jgi:hypothetical protein
MAFKTFPTPEAKQALKAIGPTFGEELVAAGISGVSIPFSADGHLAFSSKLTPEQIEIIKTVYAAHDNTKKPKDDQGTMVDTDTFDTWP